MRRIRRWRQRRKLRKRLQIFHEGLRELHTMTVTFHGRITLNRVCLDLENGLDPEIRALYWTLLQEAPVGLWAVLN